jgi:hypothetical protein
VGYYHVSESTLRRAVKRRYKKTFESLFEEKRGWGKAYLRRISWQMALSGDKTMIIWLSKQHLGFVDKLVTETIDRGDKAQTKQVGEALAKFTTMLREITTQKEVGTEDKEKKMGLLAASLGLRD